MLGHLLLESSQAGVAEGHILRFVVVQEWPLSEPNRLEGMGHYFLLSKLAFGELIVRWLMWLVLNALRHT